MTLTQVPRLGAIAVLIRENHALLVQRGKDPDRGLWSFPGGHVELGETVAEAACRELLEETALTAEALRPLGHLDLIRRDAEGRVLSHYLLMAFKCRLIHGTPVAGDDAAAVEWVSVADIRAERRPFSQGVAALTEQALS